MSDPKSFTKAATVNFTRVKEDFICENCNQTISGNGYTNHCPHCLISKHVDEDIGDRSSSCKGLMDAVAVTLKGGQCSQIIFRCCKCGFERANKVQEEDNKELLFTLLNQKK